MTKASSMTPASLWYLEFVGTGGFVDGKSPFYPGVFIAPFLHVVSHTWGW